VHPTYPTQSAASPVLFWRKQDTLLPSSNARRVAAQAKCQDIVDNRSEVLIRNLALIFRIIHSERADQLLAADKIRLWLLRVSRFRFTASAHRMTGQSVDPRLVFLSVKKSLPLGHGRDRLAYPEAALLKIVSK
jgi:hypothetical protein